MPRNLVGLREGDNRCLGLVLADDARRVAGSGRRDYCLGVEFVGKLNGGVRNGVRVRMFVLHTLHEENFFVFERLFNPERDLIHHGGGFDGIFSAGSFAAEHDDIRAVKNRVADVGNFRTGRARVNRHALQHLRCDDDGLADSVAFLDDVLLDNRHVFGGNFDAQIAARNHDSVADGNNFVNILDALKVFDFGNNFHVAAVLDDKFANFFHVACTLNETCRDKIHVVFDTEENVFGVLFADGGKSE